MAQSIQDFDEAKVVRAAQGGCVDSFGLLYKRYHSPMVALAYAKLADRDLAEDAAQEVFAVACRDIGTLKNEHKFAPWLAGICRNIARQMLRADKRRNTVTLTEQPAPEKSDDTTEQRRAIHQALQALRQPERELIVLRYFDGFSQARISQVLDLTPQAVNGRLVRAKRKIATYLTHNGFTGVDHESG